MQRGAVRNLPRRRRGEGVRIHRRQRPDLAGHAEAAPACEPASGIPERVRSDGRQRRQSRQLLCDHSVDAGGASRRSFLLSGQIARPVGNGLLGRPAARHERLHGFHRRQDDGPDGRQRGHRLSRSGDGSREMELAYLGGDRRTPSPRIRTTNGRRESRRLSTA